jgi:hypothetical protein
LEVFRLLLSLNEKQKLKIVWFKLTVADFMKKIFLIGLVVLATGCGNDVAPQNPLKNAPENSSSPSTTATTSPVKSTPPSISASPNTIPSATTAPPQTEIQSAKVTEILDGEQVFIRDRRATVEDIAKFQEQVRTGESRTELQFNNNAIARLSKNSLLTVGDCGVQLQQGSLLVNGAVPACTSTIVAAVHGTTYILEVDAEGNDQIQVLEGEVAVTRRDEAKSQIQIVRGGEKFRFLRKQKRRELKKMSQGEFEFLINSPLVKGHKRELRGQEKIKIKFKQLFPKSKPIFEKRNESKNEGGKV